MSTLMPQPASIDVFVKHRTENGSTTSRICADVTGPLRDPFDVGGELREIRRLFDRICIYRKPIEGGVQYDLENKTFKIHIELERTGNEWLDPARAETTKSLIIKLMGPTHLYLPTNDGRPQLRGQWQAWG